jgi:phage tail P2-like protein
MSFSSGPIGSEPSLQIIDPLLEPEHNLAPPNATDLERAIYDTIANLGAIDFPIEDLWNPALCPLHLLPFLAWALNVDAWDETWSDTRKRTVVASAIDTHLLKGTPEGVEHALASVGITAELLEWHEQVPEGPVHTFKIKLRLNENFGDNAVDDAALRRLFQLVDRVKRLSQHYELDMSADFEADLGLGLGFHTGPAFKATADVIGSLLLKTDIQVAATFRASPVFKARAEL